MKSAAGPRAAVRRTSAVLPPEMDGLCLVRFGLIARRWSGRGIARRLARALDTALAAPGPVGLRHAERLSTAPTHRVWMLYWNDFAALEAWARAEPHTQWWREAVERMRGRGDLGVYHEAYLVPRAGIESIYIDAPAIGLLAFAESVESDGLLTTARGRLGAGSTSTTRSG